MHSLSPNKRYRLKKSTKDSTSAISQQILPYGASSFTSKTIDVPINQDSNPLLTQEIIENVSDFFTLDEQVRGLSQVSKLTNEVSKKKTNFTPNLSRGFIEAVPVSIWCFKHHFWK